MNEQEPKVYNDPIDLLGEALRSHSNVDDINEDLALMNTDETLPLNKTIKFVRERIKTAVLLASFVPYPPASKMIRDLLLMEVRTITQATKAGKSGDFLRAILKIVETGGDIETAERVSDQLEAKTKTKLLSRRDKDEAI